MARPFRIFAEREFDDLRNALLAKLKDKIYSENANYILNVNETEYLEHLVYDIAIEPLVLHFEGMAVSSYEREIPAEHFPPTFHVYAGKSYTKPVIRYHIPFSGDGSLLYCIPNPRILNSHSVTVEGGEVCFEIVDFSGDPQALKAQADSAIRLIQEQANHLAKNVADYNVSLRSTVKSLFDARRGQLLQQNQLVAALGVPVKKSTDIPRTFAVPAVVRKPVIPRPQASSEKYIPEPSIDQAIYEEILQTIFDTGRVFERLPSTYADKDEEALRDQLIMVLEPRFQMSTTGETFNKSRKTDILMRHEGKNVFVAECKVWHGQKKHHETLDQILGYLTWRDSKAAVVYFIDTKEVAAPLKAIEESTPQHACFVAAKGKRHESWFSYEFHLPGDHSRPVQIAVLCFHLPK
jgi:hypothetical protein